MYQFLNFVPHFKKTENVPTGNGKANERRSNRCWIQ